MFELTWKYKQTAVCKMSKVPLYFIIVMIGFVFVYSNFKSVSNVLVVLGIYILFWIPNFCLVLTGSK